MNKSLKWLMGGTFAVLSAMDAAGHGGQYRGPGGSVPPNLGGGGGGSAPPSNSTDSAPSDGSSSSRTGANLGTTPPRRTGGVGGISKRAFGPGFQQWEYWWSYNKDRFWIRDRTTNTEAKVAGRGRAQRSPRYLATHDDVRQRILPGLYQVLDEEDADIVDSAVLAIARTLPAEGSDRALEAILKTLSHRQESAKQSATLSLGVLGSEAARPHLIDLMTDTPSGKRLLGDSGRVPNLIRGFAALSLGMLGHEEDVPRLIEMIDGESDNKSDLKSCAIVALGMYTSKQEEIAAYLARLIERESMNQVLRSMAPISLARLELKVARKHGLEVLIDRSADSKTDHDRVRSCVVALGRLGTMKDQAVLDVLLKIIDDHKDAQSRHLAYIALGEIASRDVDGFRDGSPAHRRVQKKLLAELERPKVAEHRPWAALSIALYVRPHQAADVRTPFMATSLEVLGDVFRDSRHPSHRGAVAIALGLLEAREMSRNLLLELMNSRQDALRGQIAVALGLMDARGAAAVLRSLMTERGLDWELRLNLARGLGLLGDVSGLAQLITQLEESGTIYEAASLAQAVGLIGDRRAIDALQGILGNSQKPGILRGFSAVALGLLAEKTPLPWNASIAIDSNYRSKTVAIAEVLDIL